VPFATFPLYPPRADVGADIVEPPVSAISGLRHRNKRPNHAGRKHDPECLDGLEVEFEFRLHFFSAGFASGPNHALNPIASFVSTLSG
jgi:hypothetical protein